MVVAMRFCVCFQRVGELAVWSGIGDVCVDCYG